LQRAGPNRYDHHEKKNQYLKREGEMRIRKLLDATDIYNEEGSVTELAEMVNLFPEEAPEQKSTVGAFLPGFGIEIPEKMRDDAEMFNNDLRDDDAPPDGNARITDIFPANRELLQYLLDHGAEEIEEGFESDYMETAETVGFNPAGPWTGYKSRNLAFFLTEEDARGYETALRKYQETGKEEGRAA
jgi:hypothetical protein